MHKFAYLPLCISAKKIIIFYNYFGVNHIFYASKRSKQYCYKYVFSRVKFVQELQCPSHLILPNYHSLFPR